MAKGETGWSSKGKQVKKGNFQPLPAGLYESALDTSRAEVRIADKEGAFPRVAVAFRHPGTGKDGGKDRMTFHDFYLRTEPNEKGTVLVEMQGQILDYVRALGTEIEPKMTTHLGERIIDPVWLKKWLTNRDGEVVQARLKVEKDLNGDPRNRVQFFEEAEGASDADEDEDEADEEAEDEEVEDEDGEDDEGDDEDEFAKATAKGKAGKVTKPSKKK
jgi:hypothetical protein